MKPIVKKVIIGTSIALAVAGIVAYNKTQRTKEIFALMDIDPDFISDLKPGLKELKFNLDIVLTNNSDDDLFITGASVATLQRIDIFYNRAYLASANVNISEISISASNQLRIKKIPVVVPTLAVLQNIGDLAQFDMDKMQIVGIVNALGKQYQIGA